MYSGEFYPFASQYEDFVRRHKDCAIFCLALGVGMNTPAITPGSGGLARRRIKGTPMSTGGKTYRAVWEAASARQP